MRQLELFTEEPRLFERLCTTAVLKQGFKAVKANRGSPGIDGVSIAEFETRLNKELIQLKEELISWTYKPEPVRRVEIPKPGGAGVRLLGVPNVRDRVVQATIKILLEPIFDPMFSNNSYGFRPERSQRQAVEAAKAIVSKGKEYVVDIDLSKFFDRVNHDRLINRLSKTIEDKRMLRIIGMTLRSGVMKDGIISATTEGTTQGSPLSPLLSNVVLDELDKELERRGHEFCRFADDCNIFVKTIKAAERVMKSITNFIETKLKLVINREKSKTALSREVKFLGMTIINKTIVIASKSIERAMEKVKELTQRGTSQNMKKTVEEINKWYKGWTGYYKMTQYPAQLHAIEAHIRRRLRARIIDQQKRRRHLVNKLLKQGIPRKLVKVTVYSNKKRWALSHMHAIEKAFPESWFRQKWGLLTVSGDKLPHWFSVRRWIRLK